MRRAGLLLVLALVLLGCARQRDVVDPEVKAAPPGTTAVAPMNDPVLDAAAQSLGPLLESRFPDTYSGLRLEQERGVLVVHRLPDPALDEFARAGAGAAELELVDARFPATKLKEVTDRIAADSEHWKAQGVELATWGPEPDGSGVRVTTLAGSESDRAALAERYGADVIVLEKGARPVTAGG